MTSQYETVEGTEPTAHGVHEPRTIKRNISPDGRFDQDHDLHMMTEIGDGIFVAWTECRRCQVRVYDCKCPEGPAEPPYMKKWRDERFEKDLNARPDPSYELIPSVISWLEERGYTVTKTEAVPTLTEAQEQEVMNAEDVPQFDREALNFDPEDEDKPLRAQIDSGLDKALDQVRAARVIDDVEVDF